MTSNNYKSKTLATWLAFLGGSLGLHRLYLRGKTDVWTLLHMAPTAVGLYGVWRMLEKGQDDQLAWLLIPALGLILAGTQLLAIIYGLTPDEKWNARFNPSGCQHQTGWLVVMGVILALMVGAGALMATLAFAMQRFFEFQQLAG
jgi:hypothetical protein